MAPQQAAPGADSAQVQYIQSLLSTMPPAQLHTMVAQAMTGVSSWTRSPLSPPCFPWLSWCCVLSFAWQVCGERKRGGRRGVIVVPKRCLSATWRSVADTCHRHV